MVSWKSSGFEASNLLLAVIVGKTVETLASTNPVLLLEINLTLSGIVIAILIGVAILRRKAVFELSRLVLKGTSWIIAILAGGTFTQGYALTILSIPIGLAFTAYVFFALVVVIHFQKSKEEALQSKIKQKSEGKKD